MTLTEDPMATAQLARYAAARTADDIRALLIEDRSPGIDASTPSGNVYAAAYGIMSLCAQIITRTGHYADLSAPGNDIAYQQGYRQGYTEAQQGTAPRA